MIFKVSQYSMTFIMLIQIENKLTVDLLDYNLTSEKNLIEHQKLQRSKYYRKEVAG